MAPEGEPTPTTGTDGLFNFRKILVSVKFVSAILGPGMAAPILWTPGKNALFLQEKAMSIKFLVLGGGGVFSVLGGGECRFYFYGRGDFSDFLIVKMLLIATVPLTAMIVGARADLLRKGQHIGPRLA